jgi:hypothetical protein
LASTSWVAAIPTCAANGAQAVSRGSGRRRRIESSVCGLARYVASWLRTVVEAGNLGAFAEPRVRLPERQLTAGDAAEQSLRASRRAERGRWRRGERATSQGAGSEGCPRLSPCGRRVGTELAGLWLMPSFIRIGRTSAMITHPW